MRSAFPTGGGAMGGWPPAPRFLLLVLALCCSLLAQPQPARASFFFGVRTTSTSSAHVPQQRGGGGREEKVPMTVVVPDYSPRPAPFGDFGTSPSATPSAAPAPAPVPGSDGGGGDGEDGTPRLPSERRSTGHRASGQAQAPAGEASSADFISSSPAVPLPAGVTDSATVLPLPTSTPGGHKLRDDVGMGTRRLEVTAVQLAVPLLMITLLSFGASVGDGVL